MNNYEIILTSLGKFGPYFIAILLLIDKFKPIFKPIGDFLKRKQEINNKDKNKVIDYELNLSQDIINRAIKDAHESGGWLRDIFSKDLSSIKESSAAAIESLRLTKGTLDLIQRDINGVHEEVVKVLDLTSRYEHMNNHVIDDLKSSIDRLSRKINGPNSNNIKKSQKKK